MGNRRYRQKFISCIHNNKGFSLLELIITISILSFIAMPFLGTFFTANRNNTSAQLKQRTAGYLNDVMQQVKSLDVHQLEKLVTLSSGNYIQIQNSKFTSVTTDPVLPVLNTIPSDMSIYYKVEKITGEQEDLDKGTVDNQEIAAGSSLTYGFTINVSNDSANPSTTIKIANDSGTSYYTRGKYTPENMGNIMTVNSAGNITMRGSDKILFEDAPRDTSVKFANTYWYKLFENETGIILKDPIKLNKIPDNTQKTTSFDLSNSGSIANVINSNSFLGTIGVTSGTTGTLSDENTGTSDSANSRWFIDKTWYTGAVSGVSTEDIVKNETSASEVCRVGLLSYSQFQKLKTQSSVIVGGVGNYWLINPVQSSSSTNLWYVDGTKTATSKNWSANCDAIDKIGISIRPVIYLKRGFVLSKGSTDYNLAEGTMAGTSTVISGTANQSGTKRYVCINFTPPTDSFTSDDRKVFLLYVDSAVPNLEFHIYNGISANGTKLYEIKNTSTSGNEFGIVEYAQSKDIYETYKINNYTISLKANVNLPKSGGGLEQRTLNTLVGKVIK